MGTAMADATEKPRAPKAEPCGTPRSRTDKAARQARLAVEMRKNLAKRKRQQRARSAPGGSGDR